MKKQFKQEVWPINQIFIFAATGLITLFLLKAASDILVPFLISIAIAIVLSPLFTYLETKRIPKVLSLIVVIMLSLLPIILFGGYVADEAKDFATNYQTIKASFLQSIQSFTAHMNHIGININENKINTILEKSNLGEILRNLATQANSQFSNLFLIFFMDLKLFTKKELAFMIEIEENFFKVVLDYISFNFS
jgi:predicted PurR-regulated permease PerM